MKHIKIEWLSDSYDCEDCGWSSAEGANVSLDGEPLVQLVPVAHCLGGSDYSDGDIYRAILEKLGYTIEEVW